MEGFEKRPYRLLCDYPELYRFLLRIDSPDWRRGAPAPFFENAQAYVAFDANASQRIALWRRGGELVAMCGYEQRLGTALFCLADGCDTLIPEMVDHAEARLRDKEGRLKLWVSDKQTAFVEEFMGRGYRECSRWPMLGGDFDKAALDAVLPEGYRFVPYDELDLDKLSLAIHRGFNHTDEPTTDGEALRHLYSAPYNTAWLAVTVQAPNGDYACHAGMWLVKECGLAYLEPLCTVPEYRKKGLAHAALSELRRRTQPLGATRMTGGDNPFYAAIGFTKLFDNLEFTK